MSHPIRSSCGRELRPPTSCIQIALFLAPIQNGAPAFYVGSTLRLTDGSYYRQAQAIPRPQQAHGLAPLIVTSARSDELIKDASNAFLAMKISFVNAVASICEHVGADVQQVCRGIGTDSRIGPRFLNPGIGYGGSCFPKDLLAFRSVSREYGYDFRLPDEVILINEEQRHRFLRKISNALWTLQGSGLASSASPSKGEPTTSASLPPSS
jgi:UDPglucose 6-dehydrogenase